MTTITALPTPPSRADSASFASRGDAFLGALPAFAAEVNAVANEINDSAAVYGSSVRATGTTSFAVGLGSRTLTVESGKGFAIGMAVKVSSSASPVNYMKGVITAYNTGTGVLTISASEIGGSGTFAAWTVSIIAETGADNGGASEVTSAVDISLTAASNRVQVVNMTAAGMSVILPNATGLTTGGAIFVIAATGLPLIIKLASGAVLQAVGINQKVMLFLTNSGTSDGSWATGVFPYQGNSFTQGPASVLNAVGIAGMIGTKLTETTAIISYYTNGTYLQKAALLDSTGQISMVEVGVTGSTTGGLKAGITTLSSTKALLFYSDMTTGVRAVVLDVSSGTIVVGTFLAVNAALSYYGDIAALSSTKALLTYAATAAYAVVLSISGMTVTAGGVVSYGQAISNYPKLCALSDTKVLGVYNDQTGGQIPKGIVFDILGTSVTPGTPVSLTGATTSLPGVLAWLSATKALWVYAAVTTVFASAKVLTVSGTTITEGAAYTLAAYAVDNNDAVITTLSPTKFLYMFGNGSARYLVIDVVNSTVCVAGAGAKVSFGVAEKAAIALTANRALYASAGTSQFLNSATLEIGLAI